MLSRVVLAAAICTTGQSALAGSPDCDQWSQFEGGEVTNGTNIFSVVEYNGDLIVSGSFDEIAGTSASYIARWDGTQWHPLGQGLSNKANAMVVYNGDLVVGGWFDTAGGIPVNSIARWDGTQWHALGTGLNSGFIRGMTVWNGDLYIAGYFPQVGGVTVNHIARWDGSQWHDLAGGTTGVGGISGQVNALTVYNGELIAGGYFDIIGGVSASRVAAWNGTSWRRLGGGVTGGLVDALTTYDGELIISGTFRYAGGRWSNRVTRYDGNGFRPLGAGVTDDPDGIWGQARALLVHDGDLYMGGTFCCVDYIDVSHIARWDGTAWHALGTGIRNDVHGLTEYNGAIVAVGNLHTAGAVPARGIGSWNLCPDEACVGDIEEDGNVNIFDLLALLKNWGTDGPGADIDAPLDVIDVFDLLGLLGAWGACN